MAISAEKRSKNFKSFAGNCDVSILEYKKNQTNKQKYILNLIRIPLEKGVAFI